MPRTRFGHDGHDGQGGQVRQGHSGHLPRSSWTQVPLNAFMGPMGPIGLMGLMILDTSTSSPADSGLHSPFPILHSLRSRTLAATHRPHKTYRPHLPLHVSRLWRGQQNKPDNRPISE